jgi:UDPglucose 6-dehydrogenase
LYAESVEAAVAGCDACVILTEWSEVVGMSLTRVRALLARPIIIDGRNCFGLDEMEREGFVYYSVGRRSIGAVNGERQSVNF